MFVKVFSVFLNFKTYKEFFTHQFDRGFQCNPIHNYTHNSVLFLVLYTILHAHMESCRMDLYLKNMNISCNWYPHRHINVSEVHVLLFYRRWGIRSLIQLFDPVPALKLFDMHILYFCLYMVFTYLLQVSLCILIHWFFYITYW